jgi:hypothetical protein
MKEGSEGTVIARTTTRVMFLIKRGMDGRIHSFRVSFVVPTMPYVTLTVMVTEDFEFRPAAVILTEYCVVGTVYGHKTDGK